MTTAALDNPTLADCGIDVMARLAAHMHATVKAAATLGNPVTKASAYYGDALGSTDVCEFIQRAARSHQFGCRIGRELGFAPSVSLWCLKGSHV